MTQPSDDKYLIVNADDFGLSEGTNRGIIRAHEHGIVTSTSLMVRQPAAEAAAGYARSNPRLSVGLHLDLGEWVVRDGEWVAAYQVVPPEDADAVAGEVSRQLAAFRSLLGRDPTHLDSHQHAHRSEPMRSVALRLAAELRVPLRHFHPKVIYRGDFYGQAAKGSPLSDAITTPALVRLIRSLPGGVSEMACHPGDDGHLDSPYCAERLAETRSLCDSSLAGVLSSEGVRLMHFSAAEIGAYIRPQ